jgi:hypothetical protein
LHINAITGVMAGWKYIEKIMMTDSMGWEGLVAHAGNGRNSYNLPARKPDSKKQLGIPKRRIILKWNQQKGGKA